MSPEQIFYRNNPLGAPVTTTRWYDHLVITTTFLCPEQKSSHFLSFTTSLIRPTRYYDHLLITTTFSCPERIETPVIP